MSSTKVSEPEVGNQKGATVLFVLLIEACPYDGPDFEGITFIGDALPRQEGINLDSIVEEANNLLEDVTQVRAQVDTLRIKHLRTHRTVRNACSGVSHGARKSKAKK